MRWALTLLWVALLAATHPARGQDATPTPLAELSLGRGADTLAVAPGQRRACLTKRPLFVGSLALEQDGEPLVLGVHYSVDENEGCLELFAPSADTTQLVATYRYLPLSASLRYRLRSPEELEAGAEPTAGAGPATPAATDGARLLVGGSKTFVVEVGSNRDAVLRQSLDLTLRGRLTRDVEVQAVLSDRDSPVTPEGTSAELQELDKVFIQIKARTASATFGHIEVAQNEGEFARYQRRLEGAQVRQAGTHILAGGVAANARGVFRSVEFFGEEGLQGPYDIGLLSGGNRVAIVPGSERVVLDGVHLRRGQDRDYVIDYSLGELTFNTSRPITFDSRVTVDYEEEAGDYRRRFVSTDGGYVAEGGLRARAFVISESDDRDAPRGFTLGSEEESLLSEIGDDDPVGETYAAREVPPGEGDYVLEAAGAESAHFDWVGPGNGNYLVSFLRVGQNLGSYTDSTLTDGTLIFVFVGSGGGDFDPGRRLARPEQHTVADVQLDWEGPRGSIRGEIAGSRHDLNTFSRRDDADNEGLAGKAEFELKGPRWAGGKGGITLSGRWRHIDPEFSPFTRITPSFDFLNWNYAPSGLVDGEDRGLVALSVEPGAGGTLTFETGRLRSGDAFEADRAVAGYERGGRLATSARWERTWSEKPGLVKGLREVRSVQSVLRLGPLRPSVRYRSELTSDSSPTDISGRRFETMGGGARLDLPGPLAVSGDYSRRVDDTRVLRTGPDEWAEASETIDRSGRLELTRWLGTSGSVEYRQRTFEPTGAGGAQETNLARLNLNAEPSQGLYRFQLDYQVTTEGVQSRNKIITFVGDGLGNYDSLGVFVGVGDYDVDIVQSDETELLSRLDLALRGNLLGRSDPRAPALLRHLRASTFVRVGQSTRLPFRELVNPFGGDLYSTRLETVEGNLVLRQEVTLFPSGVLSPRVRWERFHTLDGRFQNVRDLREEDVVTVRVQGTPTRDWTIGLEGALETERDIVERLVPTRAREEETFTTRAARGDLTHKPTLAWTTAMSATYAETVTPDTELPERRLELSPTLTWSPVRVGRIEASVRWVRVLDPLPRRRPVFDFGLTNTSGIEWSTIADYRLKDFLTLAGTLRAIRPEGEDTLYDGRMELRAFF